MESKNHIAIVINEIESLISQNTDLTTDEILRVFHLIGENGDVILMKNDGLRNESKFTVVIINNNESIRYDDETLNNALIKSLKDYVIKRK